MCVCLAVCVHAFMSVCVRVYAGAAGSFGANLISGAVLRDSSRYAVSHTGLTEVGGKDLSVTAPPK